MGSRSERLRGAPLKQPTYSFLFRPGSPEVQSSNNLNFLKTAFRSLEEGVAHVRLHPRTGLCFKFKRIVDKIPLIVLPQLPNDTRILNFRQDAHPDGSSHRRQFFTSDEISTFVLIFLPISHTISSGGPSPPHSARVFFYPDSEWRP